MVQANPETKRNLARQEAQKAAAALLRCDSADLRAWTKGEWPSAAMFNALRAIAEPTEEQENWTVQSFDALTCPSCGSECAPKSVSIRNNEPTVAYACTCGRSWRINPNGDETHVRLPKS